MMPDKQRVVWVDIWCEADIWPDWLADGKPGCMGFELFAIQSTDEDGNNAERGESIFRGSIKWDGCMNWEQSVHAHMLHSCGRFNVRNLSQALLRLYDEAEKMTGHEMWK